MILCTGSIASGKRSYLRSLGFCESDLLDAQELLGSFGLLDGGPECLGEACAQLLLALAESPKRAVCDAEMLAAVPGMDLDELASVLAGKEAVLCNEVGAGVVPISAQERAWREAAGRLAVKLAGRANRVLRLVCGIPVVLKG